VNNFAPFLLNKNSSPEKSSFSLFLFFSFSLFLFFSYFLFHYFAFDFTLSAG